MHVTPVSCANKPRNSYIDSTQYVCERLADLESLGLLFFVALSGGGLGGFALYLRAQHRALQLCAPLNRTVQPGLVWLQVVPVLGLLFQFFVVRALHDSLVREWRSRMLPENALPRNGVGLAKTIVDFVAVVLLMSGASLLPEETPRHTTALLNSAGDALMWTGCATLTVSLVLLIVYWNQLSVKTLVLRQNPAPVTTAPSYS